MKKLFILFIILISCNTDVDEQQWQKGNLHTHSFWSDGDDFPEMIIDWYKKNDCCSNQHCSLVIHINGTNYTLQ